MDIIDLGTEVIIDRSKIRDPYARLMAAAIGEALVQGSPWVAVDKRLASRCSFPLVPCGARRSALPFYVNGVSSLLAQLCVSGTCFIKASN